MSAIHSGTGNGSWAAFSRAGDSMLASAAGATRLPLVAAARSAVRGGGALVPGDPDGAAVPAAGPPAGAPSSARPAATGQLPRRSSFGRAPGNGSGRVVLPQPVRAVGLARAAAQGAA